MNVEVGEITIKFLDYTLMGQRKKKSEQCLRATIGDRIELRLVGGAKRFGTLFEIKENSLILSSVPCHSDDTLEVPFSEIEEYFVTLQGFLGKLVNQL